MDMNITIHIIQIKLSATTICCDMENRQVYVEVLKEVYFNKQENILYANFNKIKFKSKITDRHDDLKISLVITT